MPETCADRVVVRFPIVCFDEIRAIDDFFKAIKARVTYHVGLTSYASLSELPWGQSCPQLVIQAYTSRGKTSSLLAGVCVTGNSIDVKLHETVHGSWFSTLSIWLNERHDLLHADQRIQLLLEQNPRLADSVWLVRREEMMEKSSQKRKTALSLCWDRILQAVDAVITFFFKK